MRTLFCCGAVIAAAALSAPRAQAAFHLWNLQEIYTNSSGTLQFIEMHDPAGNQQFVGGQQITVFDLTFTQSHTFTVPSNMPINSFNHTLLFGTAGIASAGAPTPDFIIPDNFLFPAGGTISFFGANSGGYTALPTDGVLSRTWGGGNAVNSPQNFAGQTGMIVIPEPTILAPLAGLIALGGLLRRRRAGQN